jgi:hypothetical protein
MLLRLVRRLQLRRALAEVLQYFASYCPVVVGVFVVGGVVLELLVVPVVGVVPARLVESIVPLALAPLPITALPPVTPVLPLMPLLPADPVAPLIPALPLRPFASVAPLLLPLRSSITPEPALPLVPLAPELPVLPLVLELPWLALLDFLVLFFAFGVEWVADLASLFVLSDAVLLIWSWPAAWAPPANAIAIDAPMMPLSRLFIRIYFSLVFGKNSQKSMSWCEAV